MIDDPQIPGAGPQGTGGDASSETSMGGASEWNTVQPAQPPAPPPLPTPPAQSLEPLPPPPEQHATGAPGGYQPVYGGQPQTPPTGYTSAPGGGYTPPPPPPGNAGGPGPQYPPPPPPPGAGQGLTSNAAAAIAYITFIPAVLFLVLEPYNRDRFVRFHAWQCIALTIVAVGIGIIFAVLNVMSLHILWWLFMLIRLAIRLILFVFWLIALIKASQGQWYKIPIVGDLAQSFAGGQV
ncbi:MAG TPA: DUF4870 domain-containing protein [Acidobacteriaceae bacterium]